MHRFKIRLGALTTHWLAILDNWRNRYKSLVLHDPSTADHFPYVPYPKTWVSFFPSSEECLLIESCTTAQVHA